jgi:hypothetical protein
MYPTPIKFRIKKTAAAWHTPPDTLLQFQCNEEQNGDSRKSNKLYLRRHLFHTFILEMDECESVLIIWNKVSNDLCMGYLHLKSALYLRIYSLCIPRYSEIQIQNPYPKRLSHELEIVEKSRK